MIDALRIGDSATQIARIVQISIDILDRQIPEPGQIAAAAHQTADAVAIAEQPFHQGTADKAIASRNQNFHRSCPPFP